uniref:SHSP domain-containing protein n=1 Tax=Erythrolobus australicus TaxID=1077150 RepID=A0A7S1XGS7_9RHOD|mmetsp:Transcript_2692/g.7348  ORF Transcript_2692/g.7348 Transcript_2692/m.7348 type:complete len:187 (+) Transcript_2692:55-615(+)
MALRRVAMRGAPALWDAPFGRWDAVLRPWSYTSGGLGEVNKMLESFFDSDAGDVGAGFLGATRSYENKKGDLVLRVDLPGVKKEDLQVSAQNGSLRIHGKRRVVFPDEEDTDFETGANGTKQAEKHEHSKGSSSRKEQYAEVRQAFTVPKQYDTSNISAKLEDGILAITVPKLPAESTERKMVQIE